MKSAAVKLEKDVEATRKVKTSSSMVDAMMVSMALLAKPVT